MTKKLSTLETLLEECNESGINVEIHKLPNNIDAIYYSDEITEPIITVNETLDTQAEVCCVIAEELGHHHTSYGNILTNTKVNKATINQQEDRARKWAVKRLISIKKIIEAYNKGCRNLFEMAEYLDVSDAFLYDAFKKYSVMYGKYKVHGNYIIYFDPPGLFKKYDR